MLSKAKKRKIYFVFIITMIIFLSLIYLGCSLLANMTYSYAFGRIEEVPNEHFHTYFRYSDIDSTTYPRENFNFYSDGNRLQGFLYGAQNDKGLVIISQGMVSTRDFFLQLFFFFLNSAG